MNYHYNKTLGIEETKYNKYHLHLLGINACGSLRRKTMSCVWQDIFRLIDMHGTLGWHEKVAERLWKTHQCTVHTYTIPTQFGINHIHMQSISACCFYSMQCMISLFWYALQYIHVTMARKLYSFMSIISIRWSFIRPPKCEYLTFPFESCFMYSWIFAVCRVSSFIETTT